MGLNIILLLLLVTLLRLGWCCNNCLKSRVETIPCDYRWPNRTEVPGNNEMGVYHTRFSDCQCHIIRRGHDVTPIPDFPADGGRIFHICSPGKLYITPENYLNQQLAYYNVNCSAGQLIYFELSEMDCEPTMCFDEGVGDSKCVDYIQVRTQDNYLISEKCGTDISDLDGVILPFSSIHVLFRSSIQSRYPGFCASAVCFNPHLSSRKKRAMSFPPVASKCPKATHNQIRIPYGHTMKIRNTRTSVMNITNEETKKQIKWLEAPRICTLYSYYMNGSVQKSHVRNLQFRGNDEYRRLLYNLEIRHSSVSEVYPGPGILYVPMSSSNSHACYQRYLKNVTEFIPNKEQRQLIGDYNAGLKILVDRVEPPTLGPLIEGDFDLTKYEATPTSLPTLPSKFPDSDRIQNTRLHFKRASQLTSSHRRRTDQIGEEVLFSAVRNDVSSTNPIVKVSASGLVKAVEKENPEMIRSLRARLFYA